MAASRAAGPAPAGGIGGTTAARLAAAIGQPPERIGRGRASLDLAPAGRGTEAAGVGTIGTGTAGRRIARLALPELPTPPAIPRAPAMPRLPEIPTLPDLAQMPDLSSASGVADTARRAAGATGVDLPPQVDSLLGALSGGPHGAGASGTTPTVDDIYEGVIERLRRDLIAERERMGDLLGNLGH